MKFTDDDMLIEWIKCLSFRLSARRAMFVSSCEDVGWRIPLNVSLEWILDGDFKRERQNIEKKTMCVTLQESKAS